MNKTQMRKLGYGTLILIGVGLLLEALGAQPLSGAVLPTVAMVGAAGYQLLCAQFIRGEWRHRFLFGGLVTAVAAAVTPWLVSWLISSAEGAYSAEMIPAVIVVAAGFNLLVMATVLGALDEQRDIMDRPAATQA